MIYSIQTSMEQDVLDKFLPRQTILCAPLELRLILGLVEFVCLMEQ